MANAKLNKSLENLLVSKNRRLLEDLTKLRVSWDELSTTHEKSADTIDQLQNELNTIKQLNERLENDLMSLNKEGEGRDREGGAGLAGLDIGKPVRGPLSSLQCAYFDRMVELHLPSGPMEIHQSYRSSPHNETDSGNVMLN